MRKNVYITTNFWTSWANWSGSVERCANGLTSVNCGLLNVMVTW